MLYKKEINCSSNFYKTQDKNGFPGLPKKSWNKHSRGVFQKKSLNSQKKFLSTV